jgi:hypothetical protein
LSQPAIVHNEAWPPCATKISLCQHVWENAPCGQFNALFVLTEDVGQAILSCPRVDAAPIKAECESAPG